MLVIDRVVKEYGSVRVNDDISFTVEEGEIFGLLGPNGAGKTTLVSQIAGFIKPTQGYISVNGVDVVAKPKMARQLCSLQPQAQVSISGLTPRQAIELAGRIRNGDKQTVRRRTNELIEILEMEQWAERDAMTLSGGIRRLVTFCMAVVVPGKLVVLDEPTNDVDPIRRRLLWRLVRELADEGATVLLVTHNVLEAERSVHRLAMIDKGKMVGMGTPSSLKGDLSGHLRLEIQTIPQETLSELPKYTTVTTRSKQKLVLSIPSERVRDVVEWTVNMQETGKIEEFSLSAVTLEDAYFHIIGQQKEEPDEKGETA